MEQSLQPGIVLTEELEQILAPLVEQRQNLNQVKAGCEAEITKLTDEIKAHLKAAGYKLGDPKLMIAGYPVGLKPMNRSTIDATKLLEAGVTPAQIKAATNTTEGEAIDIGNPK